MAVSPNTDFVSGAILTATQQNNFGRGIMTSITPLTSTGAITTETLQITAPNFTAVANRYYKITYFEPSLYGSAQATYTMRIKNATAGTTLQTSSVVGWTLGFYQSGTCSAIVTLAAGTVSITATLECGTGTGQKDRSATKFAFLSIEDLGPA
jgi:hypothetical protein